jgi:circadian clock protein KaiC
MTDRLMRVPSGVAGLDAILGGGLLRGGIYIVRGKPGTGKTIFGHQFCFAHIRGGEPGGTALYVTLLAEGHARMMLHLQEMSFYGLDAVPDRLYYVNAFRTLEEDGLTGLVNVIRREIVRLQAGVVVLDGLVAVAALLPDDATFKRFIYDLQAVAGATDSTMLLLTSAGTDDQSVTPEQTMVDGIVELTRLTRGAMVIRRLEVSKFRGSNYIDGPHTLRITSDGIVLYPRFEAMYSDPSEEDPDGGRISSGIPMLDEALHGGLPAATSTLLVGPSGAGKTTLALHFLAAASEQEPSLLFGFYEAPPRLRGKARALGINLETSLLADRLTLLWQAPTERLLDQLGHRLIDAVQRTGARRVVVDGVAGFVESVAEPERLQHFFAALANQLRSMGASTLFTIETPRLFGPDVDLPVTGVSAVAENMLLLRLVEVNGHFRRMMGILKVRDSDFDPALLELSIGSSGIELTRDAFKNVDGATTGVTRRRSDGPSERNEDGAS